MPRSVLIILLVVMSLLLGVVAAVLAPLHSPGLATRLQCEPGSAMRVREYDATWLRPGETGIAMECVDAQGQVVQSRARQVRGFWLLAAIYWLPAFLVLGGLAWGVAVWARRRQARWRYG